MITINEDGSVLIKGETVISYGGVYCKPVEVHYEDCKIISKGESPAICLFSEDFEDKR